MDPGTGQSAYLLLTWLWSLTVNESSQPPRQRGTPPGFTLLTDRGWQGIYPIGLVNRYRVWKEERKIEVSTESMGWGGEYIIFYRFETKANLHTNTHKSQCHTQGKERHRDRQGCVKSNPSLKELFDLSRVWEKIWWRGHVLQNHDCRERVGLWVQGHFLTVFVGLELAASEAAVMVKAVNVGKRRSVVSYWIRRNTIRKKEEKGACISIHSLKLWQREQKRSEMKWNEYIHEPLASVKNH